MMDDCEIFARREKILKEFEEKILKEFEGLKTRTINILAALGYENKAQVLAALESGDLQRSIGFGKNAHAEVCQWLGLDVEKIDRECRHSAVFITGDMQRGYGRCVKCDELVFLLGWQGRVVAPPKV